MKYNLLPPLLTAGIFLSLGYLAAMLFEKPSPQIDPAQSELKIDSRRHLLARASEDPDSPLGIMMSIAGSDLEDLTAETLDRLRDWDYSARRQAIALFDRWLDLDPQKGWELLQKEKWSDDEGQSRFLKGLYFKRWALAHPDSALATAREIEDEKLRKSIRGSIAEIFSSHHPAHYFEILKSPYGKDLTWGRATAARYFGMADPQAAVAMIGTLDLAKRGIEGLPLSADLASGWASHDPDSALAWVRQIEEKTEQGRALRAIAKRLISVDGNRSAALFQEADALGKTRHNNGGNLNAMRYNWQDAAKYLAKTDPAAAMAWVSKHYPEDSSEMIQDFLPRNGVAAVEALAALPDTALQDGKLVEWPSDDWKPNNLEAALERLSALPQSNKNDSIKAWLLSAMAKENPQAALTNAESGLSDPTNRFHVIQSGVEQWALQDLSRAGDWLNAREPGGNTDAAIAGFIKVAQYLDPETALQWTATVSDPDARMQHLKSIYSHMRGTSGEESARAALANSSVSEAELVLLLEKNSPTKK